MAPVQLEDEPSLFTSRDSLEGNTTSSAQLYLKDWLRDTPVYVDALEIVAEKARRLWWGRQLDLATIAWTTLLTIEGRRRSIANLWAYALLPHLVSLSFAQNLFYVALLQTPSPIPTQPGETRFTRKLHQLIPEKPPNWFPHFSVFLVPLIANYLVTLWLPYSANTSLFPSAVAISKVLTLAPVILPAIVPFAWGTVHSDARAAYLDITKLFNIMSASNLLIHAWTTVTSLRYNIPPAREHRLNLTRYPPLVTETHTRLERSTTAVEKVLGSLTEHPAVAAVGKDVLLSALSLGLWAAVRTTDIDAILTLLCDTAKSAWKSIQKNIGQEGHREGATQTGSSHQLPPHQHHHQQQQHHHHHQHDVPPLSMNLRSRDGSRREPSISSAGSAEDPSTIVAPTSRRRGRPRKVKREKEQQHEPQVEGKSPEHVELMKKEEEEDDDEKDKTYHPTSVAQAEASLGDVLPEEEFDWEMAALAWGLVTVGGLGLGSAAVFGAECVSR
ncbi:hypothetical protein VTJ04DRAFT_784 [Mycothermus thermophilus]|uniref:uncharacterized protein n=1 Tax=Humicola insolens TaxID=85995 RepID=UPI003742B51E